MLRVLQARAGTLPPQVSDKSLQRFPRLAEPELAGTSIRCFLDYGLLQEDLTTFCQTADQLEAPRAGDWIGRA